MHLKLYQNKELDNHKTFVKQAKNRNDLKRLCNKMHNDEMYIHKVIEREDGTALVWYQYPTASY